MIFYPIEKCPKGQQLVGTLIPYNSASGPALRSRLSVLIEGKFHVLSDVREIELNMNLATDILAEQIKEYIDLQTKTDDDD